MSSKEVLPPLSPTSTTDNDQAEAGVVQSFIECQEGARVRQGSGVKCLCVGSGVSGEGIPQSDLCPHSRGGREECFLGLNNAEQP